MFKVSLKKIGKEPIKCESIQRNMKILKENTTTPLPVDFPIILSFCIHPTSVKGIRKNYEEVGPTIKWHRENQPIRYIK